MSRDLVAVLDDPKPKLSSCVVGPISGANSTFETLSTYFDGLLVALASGYDIGLNLAAGNTTFARAVSYLAPDRNKLQRVTELRRSGGRSTFLPVSSTTGKLLFERAERRIFDSFPALGNCGTTPKAAKLPMDRFFV